MWKELCARGVADKQRDHPIHREPFSTLRSGTVLAPISGLGRAERVDSIRFDSGKRPRHFFGAGPPRRLIAADNGERPPSPENEAGTVTESIFHGTQRHHVGQPSNDERL